jgi:hypothetical protein
MADTSRTAAVLVFFLFAIEALSPKRCIKCSNAVFPDRSLSKDAWNSEVAQMQWHHPVDSTSMHYGTAMQCDSTTSGIEVAIGLH